MTTQINKLQYLIRTASANIDLKLSVPMILTLANDALLDVGFRVATESHGSEGQREMTSKSSGFGTKAVSAQPPLKTWAWKAAIRAVLRYGDPEVADALFAPLSPTVVGTHGQAVWRGDRERKR